MNAPRTPPRFVPTLTEVVHPPMEIPVLVLDDAPEPVLAQEADSPPAALSPGLVSTHLEEDIVHRVMQRVDVSLEHHLREAIALVVQEQTRSLVPRLREEVETVVRQSVYEAVAEELASASPPVPAGGY